MCIYIYIYIYICMYVCIYIYIYMCLFKQEMLYVPFQLLLLLKHRYYFSTEGPEGDDVVQAVEELGDKVLRHLLLMLLLLVPSSYCQSHYQCV